ncbi:MAG: phosphatidate cytidylyltransferase [Pseudomonadota bacterium]
MSRSNRWAQASGGVVTEETPAKGPQSSLLTRFGDLRARIRTSAALGVGALALLAIGGWVAALLVAVLAGVMVAEYRSITARGGGQLTWDDAPYIAGSAVGILAEKAFGFFIGFDMLVLGIAVGAIIDLRKERPDLAKWGAAGVGLIGLAALAFLWLRLTDAYGVLAIVWVVLVVVAMDVGGYFSGRLIGGPKLWPSVSPNKTWAGLLGGVALAMITGLIFSGLTTGTFYQQVCAVSAAAALCALVGDMAESRVKRHFGVKDSSALLPGHGGALDRFDGLMAATLIVALVTLLRGQTVFIWS